MQPTGISSTVSNTRRRSGNASTMPTVPTNGAITAIATPSPAMFPNIFMKVSELIALVLCGGESRRMGRDKGLMLKDGMPWAQYIGQRLASYGRVFYSIHPRQREAYAAVLPADRLIVDSLDIPGPLNGLLSAHVVMPESDILLVACDMLDMDPATLDRLVS